jgi:hypothetical protein
MWSRPPARIFGDDSEHAPELVVTGRVILDPAGGV